MSSPPDAGASPPPLPRTGERTLPDVPGESYWFARHVAAYDLATRKAGGRTVLDAGCGEGYGAAAMADTGADRVVAVDLEPGVIEHIERAYPQVEPIRAELTDLPLPDGAFDLITSFQVIEHVWDVPAYLASLRRVLAPGGELLLATPNRLTFTPDSPTPVNPFHVREFDPGELQHELTGAGFRVGAMLGLHHGRRLAAIERVYGARDGVPGRSLQHRLGASPPEGWPMGLRALVHRVRPSWFVLRADAIEASLDLIAICRRADAWADDLDGPP